jgi:hypothetical protein
LGAENHAFAIDVRKKKVAERRFFGVSEDIVNWHVRKYSVFIFSKIKEHFALFFSLNSFFVHFHHTGFWTGGVVKFSSPPPSSSLKVFPSVTASPLLSPPSTDHPPSQRTSSPHVP